MSLSKIRIGILRGGRGRHYKTSLEKGAAVISHLFEYLPEKYKIFDIYIDKKNNWHIGGIPVKKELLSRKVDMVWDSASHPEYSKVLSHFSIPSICVSDFSYSLMNNREILEKHTKRVGIKTTRSIVLSINEKDLDANIGSLSQQEKEKYAKSKAREIWQKFPAPWVVKSYFPDSVIDATESSHVFGQVSIHLAKTFDELVHAIVKGIENQKNILIEEFVLGKVGALHLVPGFRGKELYTLIPPEFTHKEKSELGEISKKLHMHFSAKHYLKIDFVLHPKLGFHLLSLEFTPDTRMGSHFVQMCKRFGIKMHHIIDHILDKEQNH